MDIGVEAHCKVYGCDSIEDDEDVLVSQLGKTEVETN